MTRPNMEEAMPYIFEAQEIVNEERPVISLVAVNMVEAYRTDNYEFPAPRKWLRHEPWLLELALGT